MSPDKKFSIAFFGIIGTVAVIVIAFFVVSKNTTDPVQGVQSRDVAEDQTTVNERIRPFGRVYLPGEELESAAPTVETAAEPEPVATTMTGPQVYDVACNVCHGTGVGGAPIVGDVAEWVPRIAQGMDVLNDHAVNGFTGEAATPMLPKGGRVDLSDQEIYDAVEFMVSESQ